MPQRGLFAGIVLLLMAALAWGGMFAVVKSALPHVDAYYLTLIRYGTASLVLIVLLAALEGRRALRYEGQVWVAWLYGSFGFAGFSLFAFVGLASTRPEHAAVIMALMPLLTALVNWVWRGVRPANFTLFSVALAFAGVFLVVSKGHPQTILAGGAMTGDVLILLGALSWVIYTLGAARFPDWSALRYTALSCVLGAGTILLITLLATALGHAHGPAMDALALTLPHFVYIIIAASVIAVLAWNAGIRQLGALNGVLFINLVPITAFVIGLAQGAQFAAAEILGATLVMMALVVNNLYLRSRANAFQRASR